MTMMMRECRVKLHTFYDVVLFEEEKKRVEIHFTKWLLFLLYSFFEIQEVSLFVVTAYYFYKMKKKKVLCVLIDFCFYLFWYQFLMMMMMREYVRCVITCNMKG